jgi:hypothetical protein
MSANNAPLARPTMLSAAFPSTKQPLDDETQSSRADGSRRANRGRQQDAAKWLLRARPGSSLVRSLSQKPIIFKGSNQFSDASEHARIEASHIVFIISRDEFARRDFDRHKRFGGIEFGCGKRSSSKSRGAN